ncbi:hypothetical protein MPTK1_8g03390 [Marchantia polymorpha subsp. ruderalis]|uniref:Uncharacterized protein n=1 Tax=Marchantia polymorpha TaxID=3197 RepID=A0A2R6XJ99_MARPO|nr:hypothetical protein MARPO_0012s0130 [Marchantia polymorpha]BBN18553.1 hypothetical protein Mp_8g03390 [Marchantia polymorpha subsp. ruderalis]|eukprot:PTQ46200.1 hypothetical protein MARPO_0012s0130 [Marchantia polymorpha]
MEAVGFLSFSGASYSITRQKFVLALENICGKECMFVEACVTITYRCYTTTSDHIHPTPIYGRVLDCKPTVDREPGKGDLWRSSDDGSRFRHKFP